MSDAVRVSAVAAAVGEHHYRDVVVVVFVVDHADELLEVVVEFAYSFLAVAITDEGPY